MKNKKYKDYIVRSAFSALFCGFGYLGWQINSILDIVHHTIDTSVLDMEESAPKKAIQYTVNYIELPKEPGKSESIIDRFWDSMTFSYARRLLNLAQNENREYRLRAVESLSKIKNLDDWHYSFLAHMCDERTAVALARTEGVDQRFFLSPPKQLLFDDDVQLTTWMKELMQKLNTTCHHQCLSNFTKQNFINIQEMGHMVEHDISSSHVTPYLKETEELLPLCIKSLLHHSSVEHFAKDIVLSDGLPLLMECYKRYKDRDDIVENIVQIMANISMHPELIHDVFKTGWVGELSKLTRRPNIRISSHAVKTLINFDLDAQESKYERNIYLLHPVYRTVEKSDTDIIIVHGLLGGVFFTWRQRDLPINPYKHKRSKNGIDNVTKMAASSDPSTREYISEIEERNKLEWEEICKDYEVVFDDLPSNLEEHGPYSCSGSELLKGYDCCSQCWPKDWLPMDCKRLRILGLNYETNLSLWVPTCHLEDLESNTLEIRADGLLKKLMKIGVGQKPIVWLTHSMGGLIVKQMLTKAWESEDPVMKNIINNTKAIVFYSTPHRGSHVATLNQTATLFFWPSVEVQELKEGSPVLLRLNDKFLKMIEKTNIKVCSFVETKSTVISPLKFNLHFVPEHSARLPVGEYYKVPLDHLRICKPVNRCSFLYQKVLSLIKNVIEEQRSVNVQLENKKKF